MPSYTFSGVKNPVLHQIDANTTINNTGVGNLTIIGPVSSGLKLTNSGCGNVAINNSLSQNTCISSTGTGNIELNGPISDGFYLQSSGVGDVVFNDTIQGPANIHINGVGKIRFGEIKGQVQISVDDSAALTFTKDIGDNILFSGRLNKPVYFQNHPSTKVIEKIKALQNKGIKELLSSSNGYAFSNGISYKTGPGWIIIKEKNETTFYRTNHFSIVNGIKYLDGKPLFKMSQKPRKENWATKIDDFSKNRPGLFLLLTLGLGLFWMACRGQVSFFHIEINTVTLSIPCPRPTDTRAYYLAELPTNTLGSYVKINNDFSPRFYNRKETKEEQSCSAEPYPTQSSY